MFERSMVFHSQLLPLKCISFLIQDLLFIGPLPLFSNSIELGDKRTETNNVLCSENMPYLPRDDPTPP